MGKFIVIYGRAEYSMSAKTLNDMFPGFVRYFKDRLYEFLFGSNYVGKFNFKKKININTSNFAPYLWPPYWSWFVCTIKKLYGSWENDFHFSVSPL